MSQEVEYAENLHFLEPGGEGQDLLLSRPPALLRATLYLMAILIVAAVLWTWFSKVEIYITSIGAVRPQGDVVKVQALATGRITEVKVAEGQSVSSGSLLFVLDRRDSEALLDQVRNELAGTRSRREARQRSYSSLQREHQAQAASDRIAVDNSEVGLAQEQQRERAAEAKAAEAGEVLAAAQSDWERNEKLFEEGVISESEQRAFLSRLRIAESGQRSATADMEAAKQAVESAQNNLELIRQQVNVGLREREREAEVFSSEIALLDETIKRLELEQERLQTSREHLEIRSPVDGVVTTLGARNVGEVAQVGMLMATVAPADAPWIVESWVRNIDAGPLRENLGASVRLKFDAFPFRDYGTLGGKLVEIAHDAEFHPNLGDAYRVRITMDSLQFNRGRREGQVRLGMTLTADIVKEEERILLLLFRKVRDRVSYE